MCGRWRRRGCGRGLCGREVAWACTCVSVLGHGWAWVCVGVGLCGRGGGFAGAWAWVRMGVYVRGHVRTLAWA